MASPVKEIVAVEQVGGICIVTVLVRELDSANAEELSSRLLGLLNDGKSYKFCAGF